MANHKERAALLRETMDTAGWQLIEDWLNTQDQRINDAVKKQLISLKWEEKGKWLPYYSGEATIIDSLRKHIQFTLERPTVIDRARKGFKNPFS